MAVSGDPACEGSELAGRRSGRILRLAGVARSALEPHYSRW